MYNVCSNSMSTLHKYLNYTLDMYLFLLPSFLSLRPASDTVLAPEVIQNECCSSSAQSSAQSHQLTTFTLAVSNGPMFQCVHTELAIKWDRVSPNGPLFKCSNSQNIGKLRLLPLDRVSETFEQVRVVQVTLETYQFINFM